MLLEGEDFRWIESMSPDFSPRFTEMMDSSSFWVVLQMAVRSSNRTAWISYAWCSLRKGMLGRLFLDLDDFDEALSSSLVDILLMPAFIWFRLGCDFKEGGLLEDNETKTRLLQEFLFEFSLVATSDPFKDSRKSLFRAYLTNLPSRCRD